MENGAGIVDGTQLGVKEDVKEVVVEGCLQGSEAVGSCASKDSEEEEVFEEAVAADTPRVQSEERGVTGGSGDLGRSTEDCENLEIRNDVEKFDDAIEASHDVQTTENFEMKDKTLSKEEFLREGQTTTEKVFRDNLNGSENDVIMANGLNEQRKSADPGGSAIVVDSGDGDVMNEKSGEVSKHSENGVLDHVIVEETQVHGITEKVNIDEEVPVLEQSDNRDPSEVKGGDGNYKMEVGTNGDFFHQDEKKLTVDERSNTLEAGATNIKGGVSGQALASIDFEQKGEYQKYDSVTSNINVGHDINGELQAKEVSIHDLEKEDEIQKDVPAKVTSATNSNGNISNFGADIYAAEEERTLSPATESSAPLADPTDNNVKSSDLVAGTHKNHQSESMSIQTENERVEDEKVKRTERMDDDKMNQNVPDNKEEEARATRDVPSTNVQSETPDHPAGLEPASLLQEAATGLPSSRVQPAMSATIDPRPTGPGQAAPLLESLRDTPTSAGQSATPASTPARPAGLGRAAPLLEPAPRTAQQPRANGTVFPVQNQVVEDPTNVEAEEYDETREKLQMIRVKFLRLAHRLGQTPHNVVVAQVLYRLGLAEQLRGRTGGRVANFSFDRASAMAEQLEAAGQEPLDFSCTIMVLGKTGVGKSATINSIFDEVKFGTDAFQLGTKKVQEVVGTVHGIKVRVIDTPGLLPSLSDQHRNEKILHSVKRFIKKTPPDIILYLDRLDMQSRDFGDMPLLRTISEIFGPSIWFNAIVVLTHAASAPPEGPNGTATSYDMFVTQRSHVVQQAIRQAAGDMRLMNPVSLVENHSACRTNRAGQRVLPNGQVWKPHLLLLSFASKILAEANTLLKLQDSPPGRPYAMRTRSPPLPFLLSSLLQSRPQVKLPTDQFDDDDDELDDDLDESSGSEDESEYDQLPPFKRLTKEQLAKLPREQKKAYDNELEYREKLFMKKQLKEEKKRRKMMKKMQAAAKALPIDDDESLEESGGSASVPAPMPDLALPASFDSDNPTHRYRYLDSSNQWLVRPVLEPNGWDHDVGYEGINVERLFVVKDKIPISFSGQVSKDKKDTNIQMELASSVKHGNGKATSLGFDMQSVGKDIAYTMRSETRFSNYRKNKATAGLSVTILGDMITGGLKVEDKLIINKRGQLLMSGGAIVSRGDVAYGGSLEATLRDKDHPLGRFLSTFGLSLVDWHGDLAIGCNSQTQLPIGRNTNLIGRVNINNRGSGQVSIRLNSSEHLQIALISLIPLARKVLGYSQPVQF